MAVSYSCDVTFPSQKTLSISGKKADANATFSYTQNNDTVYTLSALTITSPTGATVTGEITVSNDQFVILVTNNSTSSSATGQPLQGANAGAGTASFNITETKASAFLAGSYSIASTLSCAEAE